METDSKLHCWMLDVGGLPSIPKKYNSANSSPSTRLQPLPTYSPGGMPLPHFLDLERRTSDRDAGIHFGHFALNSPHATCEGTTQPLIE